MQEAVPEKASGSSEITLPCHLLYEMLDFPSVEKPFDPVH